jgi:hypothetical protein
LFDNLYYLKSYKNDHLLDPLTTLGAAVLLVPLTSALGFLA